MNTQHGTAQYSTAQHIYLYICIQFSVFEIHNHFYSARLCSTVLPLLLFLLLLLLLLLVLAMVLYSACVHLRTCVYL